MAKKAKPEPARKKTLKIYPWSGAQGRFAQLRTKFPDLSGFVLVIAAVCLANAALELVLHIFISSSPIRNPQLPIGARVFLLCYSLLVLSFFVAVSMGLVFLIREPWNPIISLGRTARWITGGVAAFLIWFFLLLYGASWGLVWKCGSVVTVQSVVV